MMYFCGYVNDCRDFVGVDNSRRRLNAALANVDRHYAVVGVLEEMDKTLQVMEAMAPR